MILAAVAMGTLSLHGDGQLLAHSRQTGQSPETEAGSGSTGVPTPTGYVVGVDDVLSIRFWGDAQLSTDVVVRTDGKISIPLLNDVQAAGLTPEQLSETLEAAAAKFVTDPDATVIVREIRSRRVFVLGQGIAKQGIVALNTDMTVLQVIAASGGLLEYARKDDITILRSENGQEKRFKFNYDDVTRGRNLKQNILLQPNDTLLVN